MRTIKQWEVEKGLQVKTITNEHQEVSEEAFIELMNTNGFVGVNHEDVVELPPR